MTTLLLIGFWLFLVQNTRIGIASGTVPGAGRCARCGLGRAVRRGGASRPLVASAVRLLLRSAGAHTCGAIVDLVLCSPGSGRHAALGAARGAHVAATARGGADMSGPPGRNRRSLERRGAELLGAASRAALAGAGQSRRYSVRHGAERLGAVRRCSGRLRDVAPAGVARSRAARSRGSGSEQGSFDACGWATSYWIYSTATIVDLLSFFPITFR